jgi:hypothetical protein
MRAANASCYRPSFLITPPYPVPIAGIMKSLPMPSPSFAGILNHLLTAYVVLCVITLANFYSFYLRCAFARASRYHENAFDPKGYGFTTHLNLVDGFVMLTLYLWPVAVMLQVLLVMEKRVSFPRSILLLSLQVFFIYAVPFFVRS